MSLTASQLKQLTPVIIASNPTVNEDESKGYLVGSVVWSIAGAAFYKCTDNTTGSAVWSLAVSSSGGTVTSVAALTIGTSGTDLSSSVANGTTTPVITLNVPTASAANRGALSAADWSTFNAKQAAITPAALTKTDDTNVTLTLGGSPSTALLNAASITAGWTGTLAIARGGTNSNAALSNTRVMISSGGAIVETTDAYAVGVDWSASDSLVGFSSVSTHINRYSYDPVTKVCEQYISFSGTSDNVATTITLPYTSAAYDQNFMVLGVTNNGTASTVIGRVQISASSTTATFTRDRTALAWTASGTKTMFGQFNWITA